MLDKQAEAARIDTQAVASGFCVPAAEPRAVFLSIGHASAGEGSAFAKIDLAEAWI